MGFLQSLKEDKKKKITKKKEVLLAVGCWFLLLKKGYFQISQSCCLSYCSVFLLLLLYLKPGYVPMQLIDGGEG